MKALIIVLVILFCSCKKDNPKPKAWDRGLPNDWIDTNKLKVDTAIRYTYE